MSLTLAIEDPQQSRHRKEWLELGLYDPTRVDVEHEQNLLKILGQKNSRLVLVSQGQTPILRFMMHNFLSQDGLASLGFFALDPTADDDLIQEGFLLALHQLKSETVRKCIGPMNGNTWFSYRLRVDEHPLQFDWEPPVQPRLQRLLEASGFNVWAHYHSVATAGLKDIQPHLYKDWKRVVERGFSLRPITSKELLGSALLELHRLSQLAFADNPFFVPLSFEAFASCYLQGKSSKENFLYVAYEPLGRAVAFFLAFLEPATAGQEHGTLVFKTVGTDPQYRQQGLCSALMYAICQDLPPNISDQYISALIFQGLASESYARLGSTLWEHQYILLAKDLV